MSIRPISSHKVAMQARRNAIEGVHQRTSIHYTQQPPRWSGFNPHLLIGARHQPDFADCSAYVTWCIGSARKLVRGKLGQDVLNGQEWKAGYTGTLINHGNRHSAGVKYWYPGRTLVFYDNRHDPSRIAERRPIVVSHVAMYVGHGMVVSFGSDVGPLHLVWDYRDDFNQARAYAI